jgi:hypothetical protein
MIHATRLSSWLGAAVLSVALFGDARQAFGLATEHPGNDPIGAGWGLGNDVLAAVNLQSRVFWREVNGDPYFFFRGNTTALNEALRRFAALKADKKELVLLPGPGVTHTLVEQKPIPCDWSLHTPAGLYLAHARGKDAIVYPTHPVLTVYVNLVRPAAPADAKQVARWIEDLDRDAFAVRDQATAALEKLGNAAGPALRKALEGKPTAEARRRIQRLLDRLDGIDLEQLKIPVGVTVSECQDLLDRYRDGLKSDDGEVRGIASMRLSDLGADVEGVLPTLIARLKEEKHEYARRCLASALPRLGRPAAAALPAFREGLKDPDANVRHAFQQAINLIEKAKDAPGADRAPHNRAVREDIHRYRQALAAKKDK